MVWRFKRGPAAPAEFAALVALAALAALAAALADGNAAPAGAVSLQLGLQSVGWVTCDHVTLSWIIAIICHTGTV